MEKNFIPKILLCGDKENFIAEIGQRPFNLIAQLDFVGKVDEKDFNFFHDGKFSLNGKLHEHQELTPLLRGGGAQITSSLLI